MSRSLVITTEKRLFRQQTLTHGGLTRSPWFLGLAGLTVLILFDPLHLISDIRYKQYPLVMVMGLIGLSVLASGGRVARPAWPGVLLAILLVIAIPGLVVNKLEGEASSLFSAISLLLIPLSVYLLPRRWIRFEGVNELKWLGWIGTCFVAGAFFQIACENAGIGYARVHERAFLAPLIFLIPLLRGRKRWTTIGCGSALLLLIVDPRTTMLIVYVMSLGMWAVMFRLNSITQKLVIGGMILTGLLVSAAGPTVLKAIDDRFKSAYGMEGNSQFRSGLIQTGVDAFLASPVYGDMFRGGTSFPTGFYMETAPGRFDQEIMAPLHNDYLEFLTKGGLIGGGLMVGGIGGSAWIAWRNVKRLKSLGMTDAAHWQGAVCICICALMFTMLVNPVLNNPECAVPAYWMVAQALIGQRYVRRLNIARCLPQPVYQQEQCV